MSAAEHNGVFIADGTSDIPLADVVERIFRRYGVDVLLTPLEPGWLTPGHGLRGRFEASLQLMEGRTSVVVVHRDAEGQAPAERVQEIARVATEVSLAEHCVCVVPVRMTEARLVLDESEIRHVVGKPRGKQPLNLPKPAEAERKADPKEVLRAALLAASETSGRGREQTKRDFNEHRRQLLKRLDIDGPVRQLGAWQRLEADVAAVARILQARPTLE